MAVPYDIWEFEGEWYVSDSNGIPFCINSRAAAEQYRAMAVVVERQYEDRADLILSQWKEWLASAPPDRAQESEVNQ
jgi:hypothetical protein